MSKHNKRKFNINNEIEYYELLLQEVQAYRRLQSEPFDFGTGIIHIDGIYGSEDAYYEMEEQEIEDILDELKWEKRFNYKYIKGSNRRSTRPNRYKRKRITQQKYKKLNYKCGFAYFNEDKDRYIRYYYSNRRKYAHKWFVKKLRKNNEFKLKGNNYRKVYDYWWEID